MNNSNKQFIAVVSFFVFIIVAIVGLLVFDNKQMEKDNNSSNNSNSGSVIENDNIYTEEEQVQDSKSVTVITSNSNIDGGNSDSNVSTSDSSSNTQKSSSNSSNTNNIVPVSYFITKLSNNKIYVDGKTKIDVTIKPDNATEKEVTFKSQNTAIAVVNSDGVVTGITPGVCYIDVYVKGGGSARVEIQVLKKSNSNSNSASNSNTNSNTNSNSNVKTISVTNVNISQSKLGLKVGKSATLSATVLPSNATNKAVTWSTSNSSVATVNSNGVVTAKSAGTAVITVTTKDGGKKATCTVTVTAVKNGWVTENGKKYYYVNDVKQTNKYVDYIYLDSNGVAQPKIGDFSVTIYGAQGWVTAQLNIRQQANGTSTILGTIPESGRVTILDTDTNGFIKVKYNNITGYISTSYLFINLPDVMPYVVYEISNANASIFKTAGYSIPNVTGKNLYGYTKQYNSKIGKTTYYAPLLYPVAKKFQKAFNTAWSAGYTFKVYDTYRPRPVEELVSKNYSSLYNSNSAVKKAVDYDAQGNYWGWGWFMTTTGTSRHCQGIALDLALADKNGNELSAQTAMHTLDTRSLRKYNNANANKLSSYMTGVGFSTLSSEWWHFEDNTYKNNAYETFYIK